MSEEVKLSLLLLVFRFDYLSEVFYFYEINTFNGDFMRKACTLHLYSWPCSARLVIIKCPQFGTDWIRQTAN